MEPLTTALLAALAAAAGALLGGATDAAGGDAWAAAKTKLLGWMRLEERQQRDAFAQAVRVAVTTFRREQRPPPDAEVVLALFTIERAEARRFQQIALEELLFSARPNLGRLLDYYRRELRFAALLRREVAPAWPEIEPALRDFLSLLRQAIAKQDALRALLPDETMRDLLATSRTSAAAATDSAATLRRIEALLHELRDLPRIHATISAAEGASISAAPLTVVLGNQTTYALPAAPPPDLDALFHSYREFLIKSFSSLNFRGMGIMGKGNTALFLNLKEVYVPLYGALADTSPTVTSRSPAFRAKTADVGSNDEPSADHTPVPLHQLVRDQPFLVVLGDPGAGKSTLVKMIMLALAEGRAAELGLSDEWVPIFFPVAAFAEVRGHPGSRDLAPLAYLPAYFRGREQPDYTPLFERALLAGRALILFDGLDEVRENRREITQCLEDVITVWDTPGNRFLATSRSAGYADMPLGGVRFTRTTVQPFSKGDIHRFAVNWSMALACAGTPDTHPDDPALRQSAAGYAEKLEADIFKDAKVTDLARNPLLLTILALIYDQGTQLPRRRVELYRRCVEALAATWNGARNLAGREFELALGDEKIDEPYVVTRLGPVALWIHAENPGGMVAQRDLEDTLAETLAKTDNLKAHEATRRAQHFLRLVNYETGLLQERGPARYSFLHLTFEEYLAARALIESETVAEPDAAIQHRATDPGWREVLRLAVASANRRNAARLLRLLLTAPTEAATAGRPIILAGECLLDIGRPDVVWEAWQAVLMALLALVRDPAAPIATRVEGGTVLGLLGDPRLLDPRTGKAAGAEEYASLEDYWCAIEPGPFWFGDERIESNEKGKPPRFAPAKLRQATLPHGVKLARYPVTNAEFAAFLAANGPDGYDPAQPWWTDEGRKFLSPQGKRWSYDSDWVGKTIPRPRLWDNPKYNSPAQPLVGVSWYEAAAYCRWLTEVGHAQGWLPPDEVIRLPTSLEWECAARPGHDRREHPYPWGDATPTAEHANFAAAGVGAPSPVGCFPAGRALCGAEDLVGNVLEWLATADQDRADPAAFKPRKDFTPDERVLLSFTYYGDGLDQMCCGARIRINPLSWGSFWGFRVVQSLRAHE